MNEIDFMSTLHKSTSRDYLARVNDPLYPKHKAATLAKSSIMIIGMVTEEFVMEDINILREDGKKLQKKLMIFINFLKMQKY